MTRLSQTVLTFAATLLLSSLTPAFAQDARTSALAVSERPREIGVGYPLRKPLLDTLRPAIEADLRQPVRFVVKTLRKQDDWVFAVVTPQTKAGRRINFTKTRYAEAVREGVFDSDTIFALLEQKGRAWSVRAFVIGPTDVTYAGWPDEFGAPYPLFGLNAP